MTLQLDILEKDKHGTCVHCGIFIQINGRFCRTCRRAFLHTMNASGYLERRHLVLQKMEEMSELLDREPYPTLFDHEYIPVYSGY